jgi:small subunit ribosomal protein S8
MMTDPIADMLTRIRNAAAAKKATVVLPRSSVKYVIAKILEKEGYLAGVESQERTLVLTLRFEHGAPVVRDLKRISTPGRRVYRASADLPTVLSGTGIAIVSTSQGMMTNVEAKSRSLGGEVVCEVH